MYEVIIRDRIYIPEKIVDEYTLKDKYLPDIYNESKCKQCPYLPDRHSDTCDECPAYLGQFKLYKDKKINGINYVGIPVGNKKKWKSLITVNESKIKVIDKRVKPKFRYKIKLIRELYDYQKPAVATLVKYNNGLLESPPRSGKSPMMIAASVGKGMRTLILASQYDWLEQFYSTIMGNTESSELPFTNIPKLEEKYNKKICVIAKDGIPIQDYKDADIILSTYQRFMSKKGKKQLQKIKKSFGTVIVDEVDISPAREFTTVINAFESRSRLGCSGTMSRKDGMEFLLSHVFGPLLYTVKIKSLVPKVEFIETGIATKQQYKVLPYAYRFLATQEKRNNLILEWVLHDLKSNKKNSIVIPTTTVAHCNLLVEMINKAYGKEIACAFTAATAKTKERRTEIKEFAKSGKYRVIVGIRKMIQRGINVPVWSHLYNIMPISNIPNQTQEVSRILTPLEGKQPVIRQFLEDFGLTRGCLRTAVYQVFCKLKFNISKEQWAIVNPYLKQGQIYEVKVTKPDGSVSKEKSKAKTKYLI